MREVKQEGHKEAEGNTADGFPAAASSVILNLL